MPAENAVSARSAAHCAANCSRSLSDDDPRLLALIDAWPKLSDDARDAIVRLAGFAPDDAGDLDDVAATLAGKAVSR